MARLPRPRDDYSQEVAELAKLRRIVKVDESHPERWKKRTDYAIETLITLLIQSPKTPATDPKNDTETDTK